MVRDLRMSQVHTTGVDNWVVSGIYLLREELKVQSGAYSSWQ